MPTLEEKDEGPACNPTMLSEAKSFPVLVGLGSLRAPPGTYLLTTAKKEWEQEALVCVQAAGSQKQRLT